MSKKNSRQYCGGYAIFIRFTANERFDFEMFSMPGYAHSERYQVLADRFGVNNVRLRWVQL
jgi:hypothetical protein